MNKNIKEKIVSQIKKDEIKMKSRWLFVAQKIGLKSGLALTFILLIFLLNAFFYYIKSNNLLMWLHFGPATWQKLLHSLPYDLILIILAFSLFLNYLYKKFDFSYQRSLSLIVVTFFIIIVLGAIILFSTNFNVFLSHRLERYSIDVPFLTDFYIHRCGD